jgi:DNA-binding XRE family transcriptional regulator
MKNISAVELAKMVGVSKPTIHAWEVGKYKPSIDSLIKLSKILNCSIDHLVGNDDYK